MALCMNKETIVETVCKRNQRVTCLIVLFIMSGLLKLQAVSSLQSDVWDHFEKGEKTTKCKHCDRELFFCGSITNLWDHLLWNHAKECRAKKDSDESKCKIDKFALNTRCSSTHTRKRTITQLLVDMVAVDAWPTATVEGTGFKQLLNYLELGYRVPSAVHIISCLHERYSQVKGVVIKYRIVGYFRKVKFSQNFPINMISKKYFQKYFNQHHFEKIFLKICALASYVRS